MRFYFISWRRNRRTNNEDAKWGQLRSKDAPVRVTERRQHWHWPHWKHWHTNTDLTESTGTLTLITLIHWHWSHWRHWRRLHRSHRHTDTNFTRNTDILTLTSLRKEIDLSILFCIDQSMPIENRGIFWFYVLKSNVGFYISIGWKNDVLDASLFLV